MSIKSFEKLSDERKNNILSCGISEFSGCSYSEASTDVITKKCGISKGILFHYFGSKKEFYLYCLKHCIDVVSSVSKADSTSIDFYDVLYSAMELSVRRNIEYPSEMKFIHTASMENHAQVAEESHILLNTYEQKLRKQTTTIVRNAVSTLSLKGENNLLAISALMLYLNTIIDKYLDTYKNSPNKFYEKTELVKAELKQYVDFMLYGIAV